MFRRLVVTSSLMLGSLIALGPAALAQSVDVPFSGTVPVQATFSTGSAGTAETMVSGSPGTITNIFESSTPATLAVQSSTPATITVSPPRFVSGPTPDPAGTIGIGFLKFGSTNVRSDVGSGTASLPTGETQLEVNLHVERPGVFMPGNYTYVVTLSVTP